jgi:hypothetical protein
MPATPPPRPRLVRPEEPLEAPPSPAPRRELPRWLLPALLLAALVVAGVGWSSATRRAAALEARVAELAAALGAARAEIVARQRHLDAVRSAAAELEERVAALRALADRSPVPAPAAPAPAEPAPGTQ